MKKAPLIALRTNVLWDGTTWKSITQPSIIIGKETTTISIYADLNPTLITSNETIDRINTTTNPISITFDSKLKANIYNQLLFNVRNTLSNGQDPVEVVYPIFFNQYNLPNKRLQSNMHLFQTILETYGVDWAGFYPNTFQQLKLEASSKGYYKTIKNPFSNLFSGDATMDYSEYTQAQNTLNFRGNVINSMQDLKGYVIYIPKIVNSKVVSYFIYGTDFFGDFMPTQDGNYYLTNN